MTFDFNIDIWTRTLLELGFSNPSTIEESEVNFEIQKWKSQQHYIEIFLEKKKIHKVLVFKKGEDYPETHLIPTSHFISENYSQFRNSQINIIFSKN